MVQLAFATKQLRELCASSAKAKRELGEVVATKLQRRLADLRAGSHAVDFPAGRPREVEEGGRKMIAVDLADGMVLLFCANHNRTPTLEDGRVDWARVTRVQILDVRCGDD